MSGVLNYVESVSNAFEVLKRSIQSVVSFNYHDLVHSVRSVVLSISVLFVNLEAF